MKKILLPFLFLLLFFTSNAQSKENIYYYYKGQKVYFPVSYDRLVVGIEAGHSFKDLQSKLSGAIKVAADSIEETFAGKELLIKLGRNKIKDIAPLIAKLKQHAQVLFARPVFLTPSGKYSSYGADFIVKLKASVNFSQVQALMESTGCSLIKKYPFQDDMYILAAGRAADYNGLAMANTFYESGLFDYAEPNKIVYDALDVAPNTPPGLHKTKNTAPAVATPNDPLYNLQWAHNNTGSAAQFSGTAGADMKIQQAWEISMGSPAIKVGVIDEGVDLTHPDLQANLLQGFNGQTLTSNPGDGAPLNPANAHGTNCSGIIAAIANNNIGIAGVAPNCKIIPAVIFGNGGTYLGDAAVAGSFDYVRLNGADVISDSWGGGSVSSTIDAAINRAVTLGRDGKGCVVLFSSGNDDAGVAYPATNPQVISVGGINMCNQRKTTVSCDGEYWWGANYGAGLNVVAPCVKIASTDIQGTGGYNTDAGTAGDYYSIFNGTSSACPNAAGVVALILSVNPALTVAQAARILEYGCDKVPGYAYALSNDPLQPNGTWNNETGHGRVNAFASLQIASGCTFPTITAPVVTQIACPSNSGSIEINATGSGTLEYSFDGGNSFQASNTLNNAAPGNYYIAVRIQGSALGCFQTYSGNPVVINAPVVNIFFSAPVVTQPVCPTLTGTITVNAVGISALEYSMDGGSTYQASNIFSGLVPGNYNIVARFQGSLYCTQHYSGNPVVMIPGNLTSSTTSYTGPFVAIPDAYVPGVNIPLAVSGLNNIIRDLDFRLDAGPGTCDITENNTNASVQHTWPGDLVFKLTSPAGTTITLISKRGSGGNNFCNVLLDDDGAYPAVSTMPGTGGISGNYKPESPLSAFDGENPNGTWILNVSDNAAEDVGGLNRFSLVLTTDLPCPVVPNVITTGALTAFSTCAGSASAEQTFTVDGTNLTGNIDVTAPPSFEISLTTGTGFTGDISLNATDGIVGTTTVYVRAAAAASGTLSGNISCASAGAISRSIPVNGSVNGEPSVPGPLAGPVNICPYIGTGTQLTYSVPAIEGVTSYTWIIPPTLTLVSGQGTNSIQVTIGSNFRDVANKQVRVTAFSPCGSSLQALFYLVAQLPGTPRPISGNTNVCDFLGAGSITYVIPSVPAASAYIWTAQDGTATLVHPNGTGVNDTIVQVLFSSGFTTSPITVQSVNNCGTSGTRSLSIVRSSALKPGPITGPTNACAYIAPTEAVATYSVAPVANALSYNWILPAEVSELTGQGTNSISFKFPAGFMSGTVSVTATNGCGTSDVRSQNITRLAPSAPGIIDVINTLPCPNRVYTYTLAAMPAQTTSVQWTAPIGGTIVSGEGTNSITVLYTSAAISGVVTAQAFNNCAYSGIRTSAVKLPACPPPTFARGYDDKNGSFIPSVEAMQVQISPNPSVSDFALQVLTAGKEPVLVRIFDLQGRQLKMTKVLPYETIHIGKELKAGLYFVETRQGKTVRRTSVVKL